MPPKNNKGIKINGKEGKIHFIEGMSGHGNPLLNAKLIPREELVDLGEFLRRRGKPIAFTTGVYDMIHIGHSRYLQLAKSLVGDLGILIVGLNSDESVHELKGPSRPILGEKQRAEMLSFLGFVDFITIFSEKTGAEVINLIKPNAYLCVEGSWDGDIVTKEEVKAVFKCGGEVFYTPRQDPSLSTSEIISKIEKSRDSWLMEQFKEVMGGQK